MASEGQPSFVSGRLPFDPDRMRAAEGSAALPPRERSEAPWTVGQLAGRIGGALRDGLPTSVRVRGEVSNARERTHWYFDLKDAEAVVSCVLFASSARRSPDLPEDGRACIATGRVEFYARGGRTTLIVDRLEAEGVGRLEAEFRRLCDDLRTLGLLDEARKRPVPTAPRRVAVLTSATGAALQDVLDTARRRFPGTGWCLVDVPVQGAGAAARIASSLASVGRSAGRLGIDAVLLTRGGGSLEDLWAFNERVLAEAVAACPIPVVVAVGHETDVTIAELVADLRCATPTQAAVRLTPDREALLEQWSASSGRLRRAMTRRAQEGAQRVERVLRRPVIVAPERLVVSARERTERAGDGLRRAIRAQLGDAGRRADRAAARLARLEREGARGAEARLGSAEGRLRAALRHRLASAGVEGVERRLVRAMQGAVRERVRALEAGGRALEAVSPMGVLRRGFSVTLGPDGKALRSAEGVRTGDVLETRLADGRVRSRVENAASGSPARRRRAKGEGAASEADQMDLF